MEIIVVITTYNRPEYLLNLLHDIERHKSDHNINIQIYDDKSYEDYSQVLNWIKKSDIHTDFNVIVEHKGKAKYWQTINLIYNNIKNATFDYVIQLPDDVRLVPDFFNKAISIFKGIKSPNTICLNLLKELTRNERNWTHITPVNVNNDVCRTGWMDLCYMANKKYFALLNWAIEPINPVWSENPAKSSGVGMQISNRIINKRYFFHQVKRSLVIHDDHPSVMHPGERIKTPIITNHMIKDKIYASIASIPERELSLEETVASLLPQVDFIHVYLNNYEAVPEFLKHPKIIPLLSKHADGDLGDAGKFYFAQSINGYHFTCDDDIIYPQDYVEKTINAIEQNRRLAVVTYHGRIFNSHPVKSYYHGDFSWFGCLHLVMASQFVQIPGTGVLAYHTNTIYVRLRAFKASNMADIWMGIICQKQEVPIICLKHKAGWITESKKYIREHSIYASCHKHDEYQTKVINEFKWKLNKI